MWIETSVSQTWLIYFRKKKHIFDLSRACWVHRVFATLPHGCFGSHTAGVRNNRSRQMTKKNYIKSNAPSCLHFSYTLSSSVSDCVHLSLSLLQGHDDDGLWLVSHHQTMGGTEQGILHSQPSHIVTWLSAGQLDCGCKRLQYVGDTEEFIKEMFFRPIGADMQTALLSPCLPSCSSVFINRLFSLKWNS